MPLNEAGIRTVLITTGCYSPGYKGGGPIRSLANLVDKLGDEFQFNIITLDRDLGDRRPYQGIKSHSWYPIGKANVLYLSRSESSWWNLKKLLSSFKYDVLYLNSYFTGLNIKIIWLELMRIIPSRPIIIAPRGEFSQSAMMLKSNKKRTYIWITDLMKAYRKVIWHASSEYEAGDINREIKYGRPIIKTINTLMTITPGPQHTSQFREKYTGDLRIIFLSRISRMKNLDFALKALREVKGQVTFDIYGPLEDKKYWKECKLLMDDLPSNVGAKYCGSVNPNNVPAILSNYHIFLLPTRGENFGHAIFEALSSGCPVVMSDQTKWRDLEGKKVGWDLPLSDIGRFREILQRCITMDATEYNKWSVCSRQYAERIITEQEELTLQSYRDLFSRTDKYLMA